jgi:hypothetical protein
MDSNIGVLAQHLDIKHIRSVLETQTWVLTTLISKTSEGEKMLITLFKGRMHGEATRMMQRGKLVVETIDIG